MSKKKTVMLGSVYEIYFEISLFRDGFKTFEYDANLYKL